MDKIIPSIEEILAAGELPKPEPHEEAVEIAIPNKETIGDAGHRG
jgi:CRISPR-associated protein Cas1